MKPALTAEEWEDITALAAIPDYWDESQRADQVEYSINTVDHPNFHRAAALALYGQPFGFTREDVAWLQDIGQHFDKMGLIHLDSRDAYSLADRIEALLPPDAA